MDKPGPAAVGWRTRRVLKGGAPAQLVLGGRSVVARVRRRMPWLGTIGPVLTLADAAAVVIAGVVATDGSPATVVAAAGVAVLVARAADLHRPRLVLSIVEDLPGLFVAAAAATAVLVGAGSAVSRRSACSPSPAWCSRTPWSTPAPTCCAVVGRLGRPVLVVGTGTTARRLALTLLTRPELGLRPVGFVGTGPASALDQARGLPLALLGPVAGLPRSMTETHVDTVVVALSCAGRRRGDRCDRRAARRARRRLRRSGLVPAGAGARPPPARAGRRHPGRAPAPAGRVAPGAGVQAAGRGARRPGHAGGPAPRLRGAGACWSGSRRAACWSASRGSTSAVGR